MAKIDRSGAVGRGTRTGAGVGRRGRGVDATPFVALTAVGGGTLVLFSLWLASLPTLSVLAFGVAALPVLTRGR